MTSRDGSGAVSEIGLAESLEQYLVERHGLMISGDDLRRVLGYPSGDAFRQALARAIVPVPVFSLPNRRGKFALAKDVAAWIAAQRERQVATGSSAAKRGKTRKGGRTAM